MRTAVSSILTGLSWMAVSSLLKSQKEGVEGLQLLEDTLGLDLVGGMIREATRLITGTDTALATHPRGTDHILLITDADHTPPLMTTGAGRTLLITDGTDLAQDPRIITGTTGHPLQSGAGVTGDLTLVTLTTGLHLRTIEGDMIVLSPDHILLRDTGKGATREASHRRGVICRSVAGRLLRGARGIIRERVTLIVAVLAPLALGHLPGHPRQMFHCCFLFRSYYLYFKMILHYGLF